MKHVILILVMTTGHDRGEARVDMCDCVVTICAATYQVGHITTCRQLISLLKELLVGHGGTAMRKEASK